MAFCVSCTLFRPYLTNFQILKPYLLHWKDFPVQ